MALRFESGTLKFINKQEGKKEIFDAETMSANYV